MLVKTTILLSLTIFLFVRDVHGRPSDMDSGSYPLSVCYSLKCPADTTLCKKSSEISEADRSKLLVEIQCYGDNGNVLKSSNLTEDNPFGPNVYYKGTKFSAVIKLPSNFRGTDNGGEPDDDKEFSLGPSKPDSGPKSEVEDLSS